MLLAAAFLCFFDNAAQNPAFRCFWKVLSAAISDNGKDLLRSFLIWADPQTAAAADQDNHPQKQGLSQIHPLSGTAFFLFLCFFGCCCGFRVQIVSAGRFQSSRRCCLRETFRYVTGSGSLFLLMNVSQKAKPGKHQDYTNAKKNTEAYDVKLPFSAVVAADGIFLCLVYP